MGVDKTADDVRVARARQEIEGAILETMDSYKLSRSELIYIMCLILGGNARYVSRVPKRRGKAGP